MRLGLFNVFLSLLFLLSCHVTLHAQTSNEVPFVVSYSLKGGFYDEAITVELAASLPGSQIFYTLNGDEPKGPTAKRLSLIHI